MFQKNSFSVPSDSSGILLVKVIQTRKCNSVKHAKIGKFLYLLNQLKNLPAARRPEQQSLVCTFY
jgi:hypothetical protein